MSGGSAESEARLFAGIPEPDGDHLHLYLLGSGFGESQVLVFPDSRVLVVDCCLEGDTNLTEGLLDDLGIDAIDLLVATHPHEDHVCGIDDLLARFDVRRMWTYPRTVRDLVARVQNLEGIEGGRLSRLQGALNAIHEAGEEGIQIDLAGTDSLQWPRHAGAEYRVVSIAPTTSDQLKAQDRIARQITFERDREKPELRESFIRALLGGASASEELNGLSIALSVAWHDLRLVLGGDVPIGESFRRGWRGILRSLGESGRLSLIRDAAFVKVAHHGSKGSFHEPVWKEHSYSAKVPLTGITPYNRGHSNPPHDEVLAALRSHGERLAVTSPEGDAQARAEKAGWLPVPGAPSHEQPVISLRFNCRGLEEIHLGRPAQLYDAHAAGAESPD